GGYELVHLGEIYVSPAERERLRNGTGRPLDRVLDGHVHAIEGRAHGEAGSRGDRPEATGIVHGDAEDQVTVRGGRGGRARDTVGGGGATGPIVGRHVEWRRRGDAAVRADHDPPIAAGRAGGG